LKINYSSLISNLNWDRPSYVLTGSDFFRDGGECIRELFVASQALQKHEDQNIDGNQYVVDDGNCSAVAVIVADWEDHRVTSKLERKSRMEIRPENYVKKFSRSILQEQLVLV
jgi:hypothetical protein